MSWCWCFRWQMVVVAAVFMVFLTNPGRSQPQTNVLTQSCSLVNVTNTQNFSINLKDTFRDVRRQLSDPNTYFATSNLTRNSEPVYVMIQCRNYMSKSDCLRCFDFAARSIRSCAASNGGRLALEGCFLRYESNWFYDQYGILPEVSPGVCGNSTSSRQSVFETTVDGLLTNLSIATPKINGLYAAVKTSIVGTNTTTAYAIAQCAETATPNGCKSCLQLAYDNIRSCATDFSDGMAVLLGCFMRFSATAFFRNNQTTDITPFLRDGRGRSSNKGAIIGGVGGLFLLLIGVLLWYSRSKGTTQGDSLYGVTKLQGSKDYSYSDLRKGTENFSDENKLGEGGFGDVYKVLTTSIH
ncbi:putative non-specific serine/threonine protein kinase [Helianthus debilis subsp. tardiflorus]